MAKSIPESRDFLPQMTIWDPAPARGISASDDVTAVSIPESEPFSVSDDNRGICAAREFLLQMTTRAGPIQNPNRFLSRMTIGGSAPAREISASDNERQFQSQDTENFCLR